MGTILYLGTLWICCYFCRMILRCCSWKFFQILISRQKRSRKIMNMIRLGVKLWVLLFHLLRYQNPKVENRIWLPLGATKSFWKGFLLFFFVIVKHLLTFSWKWLIILWIQFRINQIYMQHRKENLIIFRRKYFCHLSRWIFSLVIINVLHR